jgi:hypothetical protein
MTQPAKRSSKRPQGRPEKDPVERQVIGARVPLGLYQHLVDAAAANRNTISTEIERRLALSFAPNAATPSDELHAFEKDVMTAFKAAGRRQSRNTEAFEKGGRQELSPDVWMKDPVVFTEAAARAFETIVVWHPKVLFGLAMRLIYVLRASLDKEWQQILREADPDERRELIEDANSMERIMTPPPSLLGPLPNLPGEKDD